MDEARAIIRFRVAGTLRFLSHAEMARVWQRALARAAQPSLSSRGLDKEGWAVRYSQGFNPHPRLSLPLPRPVGVEADDERLVVRLDEAGAGTFPDRAERETALKQALAEQMPGGIEILAVDLVPAGASAQPQTAEYVFPLRVEENPGLVERLREAAAQVMAGDRCLVERAAAEGRAARPVDVRPFLESIRVEKGALIVRHRTGAGGSIRVDEIQRLFGLPTQDLAGPVRRTNVIWTDSKSQTANPKGDPEDGTGNVD
ncbi:MAG: DUF2344 domain-containing protein [Planctomycetes bacterium]|nr:DUF2344 domain-containing protein [Planctomycetota bacterium]